MPLLLYNQNNIIKKLKNKPRDGVLGGSSYMHFIAEIGRITV
jgi:hypothetical protein